MRFYKRKLLNALIDEGWELVEVNEDNRHWWCDEHWVIRSVRENWGLEFMIFFLVDPHGDSVRKKGQGIWQIAATVAFPENWIEAGRGIATISMSKGKFDSKLKDFISFLIEYRRNASDHRPPAPYASQR